MLKDATEHKPPIQTVLMEDRLLVEKVFQDSLVATGIRPMMEITSIDGLPVKEYADRFIQPFQSGSTPQNIEMLTYTYRLLSGHKDKPVDLTFKDEQGKTFSRRLPRSGYNNVEPVKSFRFQVLAGNIAYVQLNDFASEKSVAGFKAAFDSISQTDGMIIDLRLNSGGNSIYGWEVLSYLTGKPFKTGSYSSRLYSPLRRFQGETIVFEKVKTDTAGIAPNGKHLYSKPIAVLTGSRTFSAAEDFLVAFDAIKRGVIIGEPTGGSTGQSLLIYLPGGAAARICTKRDMYPDGTEWNAKGIQPDILIKPKVTDWHAGRDTVLDAAVKTIKEYK